MKSKKRFFLKHKKSSALVISIVVHAVLLTVAVLFVAVSVYVRPEQQFEVKEVKRPNMKLRKLKVPVKEQKKTQAPKLRHNIVTKPKLKNIEIRMPEIIGVKGGLGSGRGEGLGGLGFGFDMDLFGSSRGTGNEFVGTFYDLKQSQDGELTEIGEVADDRRKADPLAHKLIRRFTGSGFNERSLSKYFKAPKLKYATVFMMPTMDANAAPKAFGVQDLVKPKYWLCHYKGQIAAPETGRYRFCGHGDDTLIVRVGKRIVLDACYPGHIGRMTSWISDDPDNRRFPIDTPGLPGINFEEVRSQIKDNGGYERKGSHYNAFKAVRIDGNPVTDYHVVSMRVIIGDWIELKKGQVVDVDILIGELPGGKFTCRLMIEQEGEQYKMVPSDAGLRPVLPAFKTTSVEEKLIPQMKINSEQITLEGPLFGAKVNASSKGM